MPLSQFDFFFLTTLDPSTTCTSTGSSMLLLLFLRVSLSLSLSLSAHPLFSFFLSLPLPEPHSAHAAAIVSFKLVLPSYPFASLYYSTIQPLQQYASAVSGQPM